MPSVVVLGETPMLWGSRNADAIQHHACTVYSDEIEMWLNSL